MKLEINNDDLRIVPEDAQDRQYLTHVLGLHADGYVCDARRCDVILGFGAKSELACIRLVRRPEPQTTGKDGKA